MSHLPSVEAGLRYWGAIRQHAAAGSPSHRTAATMVKIYEAAREAILSGEVHGA